MHDILQKFLTLLNWNIEYMGTIVKKKVFWNNACISHQEVSEHCVFFGLRGSRKNGGIYVQDALAKKASVVVIEEEYAHLLSDVKKKHIFLAIIVKDALATLIAIARHIRESQRGKCTIIGVTGSAGKTTTKSIIHHLLHEYQGAVSSEGNLNTVQGLCISLISIDWQHAKFGVFECGISEDKEMKVLAGILLPDYAVVTNVGNAHLGGFSDIQHLRKEKLRIAMYMSKSNILWLPEEDETLLQLARTHDFISCKICTHGLQSLGGGIACEDKGIEGIRILDGAEEYVVPLIGLVNIRNMLTALSVVKYFGMDNIACKNAIHTLKGIKRRYQIVSRSPLFIDDSYNASPYSVKEALSWFGSLNNTIKVCVLGGMRELGVQSNELHKMIVEHVRTCEISTVILHGTEYKNIFNEHSESSHIIFLDSKQEIINYLQKIIKNTDNKDILAIFCKGSLYYGLEDIAKVLIGTH